MLRKFRNRAAQICQRLPGLLPTPSFTHLPKLTTVQANNIGLYDIAYLLSYAVGGSFDLIVNSLKHHVLVQYVVCILSLFSALTVLRSQVVSILIY